MTRKEPQFNDDASAAILTATPSEARVSEPPKTGAPVVRSATPWLLWFLVVISLALSFGMAFFGLDEAGRYQAALNKAESQAKSLEATIERLNAAQAQGIGELAQSDAQLRQTLVSLEQRIQESVSAQLKPLTDRQVQLDRSITANKGSSDERLALLAEQLNTERNRIDALADSASALAALQTASNESRQAIEMIRGQLETLTTAQAELSQAISTLRVGIDGVNAEIQRLSGDSGQSLAVDLVIEQVDRLAQEVSAQGQLLQAVDASRKQLTQRLIDLDERLNQTAQP